MWRTELTAGCGGITVPCLNRAVRMKYNCVQLTQKPGERGDGSTKEADMNQSESRSEKKMQKPKIKALALLFCPGL